VVIKEEERGISLRRLKSILAVAAMASTATMESQHQKNVQVSYLKERAQKVAANPLDGFGGGVKSWHSRLRIHHDQCWKCAEAVGASVVHLPRYFVIVTGAEKVRFGHIPLAYHREGYFAGDVFVGVMANQELVDDGGGVGGCDGELDYYLHHGFHQWKSECCC